MEDRGKVGRQVREVNRSLEPQVLNVKMTNSAKSESGEENVMSTRGVHSEIIKRKSNELSMTHPRQPKI